MEYNVFRDYCKAENSDDEEVNHDLQSRLYAEIYYTSNFTKNVDEKTDIKLEITGTNENLYTNTSTTEICGINDTSVKNDASKNNKKICSINDSMNIAFIEKDDKPDIKSIHFASEAELLHKDINNKSDVNICKEFNENIELSKNNKQSTACHDMEYVQSNSNYSSSCNIENDVHVKPEAENESKEELRVLQSSNNEMIITQSAHLNSLKHNIDNSNMKCQQTTYNKTNIDNILKKYDFAKSFINKLYTQKYQNLKKKLYEVEEEEKEKSLRQKEQEIVNVKENETNQLYQKSHQGKSINEVDIETKYDIIGRTDKFKRSVNYTEEITLISSETETDSEESILEVPIPPKPQPPVINLQDSDECSESSSSSSDTDQESSFVLEKKVDVTKRRKKKNSVIDQDSDCSTLIIDNVNDTSVTEDIMLNCTAIQKGASSIKEIMQMSKNVQSVQYSDKDESFYENFTNIDNISEFQSPKPFDNSNVIYEKDKNKSINFAEDTMVSNFINSDEAVTPSRKRHYENDNVPSTSVQENRDLGIENKRFKPSTEQHNVDDNQKSWEEYIFQPISENLKTFYESREQQNFDVEEIQSKMSNEDLMPGLLKRHRYWNMKCFNCFRKGHREHNCPELLKPLRCHMCGTQGHTETRCPQKMCLTCGKKQGTFRKTCESCRILYCDMCSAVGHKSSECPDLWRRFHQTTRISEINIPENLSEVMKPADLLYCCNCTKRGHDSSTCSEYQWSQHFPTPAYVSNYTGGPEYEVPVHKNTNEDIIPLSNVKKHKSMIFLQGKDDLDKLMMRVRSTADLCRYIAEIFIFWLKLSNEDKNLEMCIHLPRNTKRLLKILTTKLEEVDQISQDQISQDPNYLCSEIDQLQKLMVNIQDPARSVAISKKILECRSNLIKIFHTKPRCSDVLKKLKKVVKYLKRCGTTEIFLTLYLKIIVIYNKMFLPRSLTNVELQRLLRKYHVNNKRNKEKENNINKKQKRKKCNFETFVRDLHKFNESMNAQKAYSKTNDNDACSSKDIEIRDEHMPSIIFTSVKNTSTNNNRHPNNIQIIPYNAENTSNEEHNIEHNVTESSDVVHPIECIELPHSQNIPRQKPIQPSRKIKNVPCAKIKPSGNNTEKQSETLNSNNEEANTSDIQQQDNQINSEVSGTKKKKSKKVKKAKLDLQNSSEVTQNEVTIIDTSLENNANEIIKEALEFNLPYMNQAVGEIQKRINDKNLKQEHIDTLQRLINLEKDHRKYVSSFCNYFQ
ncbi:Zinc finger CCHC domain-containing protein 7 [Eufriesea mexicana]|uniref:Zinc finger CCHC domain-containing protein 7 n=1 Tax=Eufriesea mexicana TaxID=516756 RepID=A0A310S731_9HYME|nr:Zinc finger CCHC domain-containing protein 7 [Eufriesea mexicana]